MNASKGTYWIGASVLAIVIALPLVIVLLLSPEANGCGSALGASQADPSGAASQGIPANYLRDYQEAGKQYGIPWPVLAGIGKIETNHGRLQAQGVTSGANFAGAAGPMQIGIGGAAGDNWSRVGVDGDHDGKKDIYDPDDAIPGAARYLKASGAKNLHDMIFSYNHADWYVDKVMANARSYAGKDAGELTDPANDAGGADCSDLGGTFTGSGNFKVAPGANAPGRPLTRDLDQFISKVAGAYKELGAKQPLVLTTGTNHDQYSSSGLVSDHYTGNAGDFGMVLNGGTNDGPVGDRIAAAAFMATGVPKGEAIKRGKQGGLVSLHSNGFRIQIIWKTNEGGDHHNHVHIGVKRE